MTPTKQGAANPAHRPLRREATKRRHGLEAAAKRDGYLKASTALTLWKKGAAIMVLVADLDEMTQPRGATYKTNQELPTGV